MPKPNAISMPSHGWRPSWYREQYARDWEVVRDAFYRDWARSSKSTRIESGLHRRALGGAQRPAAGGARIPAVDEARLPRPDTQLAHRWELAESALELGFAASQHFSTAWSIDLEHDVRTEWESPENPLGRLLAWQEVRHYVRHAFDLATG